VESSTGGVNIVGSTAYATTLTSNGPIQLSTNNGASVQATLTSTGLGIGTSSPASKLHVANAGTLTARFENTSSAANVYLQLKQTTGTYTTAINASSIYYDDTAGRPYIWYQNGSERVRIDSAGNVGIGTSAPNEKLTVAGGLATTGIVARFVNPVSGGDAKIGFSDTLTYNWTAGTTGNNFTISSAEYGGTAGVERVRIDSSGNLMVGTASAGAKLTVTTTTASGANITFDGSVGNGILLKTTYASATGGTYISFANSAGAATGTINQTGTSTVAYTTSSDYRLKEDVQPMVGALERISALNPVTYKWKADGSDAEGFIAHELQAVIPACVVGEKDAVDADGNPKYQGIDTSFLVATLTAAIQEQQAIIESLTARISALEGN
jgi:hypothetical protein